MTLNEINKYQEYKDDEITRRDLIPRDSKSSIIDYLTIFTLHEIFTKRKISFDDLRDFIDNIVDRSY